MEVGIKFAWLILGLIHLPPAAVLGWPDFTERLYGVDPSGDVGLLIVHRGAMFFVMVALAVFAAFDAKVRRLAAIGLAGSIGGFLFVYVRGGLPAGELRTVALVDVGALLPLFFVSMNAWRAG